MIEDVLTETKEFLVKLGCSVQEEKTEKGIDLLYKLSKKSSIRKISFYDAVIEFYSGNKTERIEEGLHTIANKYAFKLQVWDPW